MPTQRIGLFALLLSASLVASCSGSDDDGGPGSGDAGVAGAVDGGPGYDAGFAAPPGTVVLTFLGSIWSPFPASQGRQRWYASISIANGAGNPNAPLAPPLFSAETAEGAAVAGVVDSTIDTACPADVMLIDGSSRTCAFAFDIPEGETPVRITYQQVDGGEASTDVLPCSPTLAAGYCAFGFGCLDGTCQAPCSAENPMGYCTGADESCREGMCLAPCSDDNRNGYCEGDAACLSGVCDNSCPRFNNNNITACTDCFSALPQCQNGCLDLACQDCFLACISGGAAECSSTCLMQVQSTVALLSTECPICIN